MAWWFHQIYNFLITDAVETTMCDEYIADWFSSARSAIRSSAPRSTSACSPRTSSPSTRPSGGGWGSRRRRDRYVFIVLGAVFWWYGWLLCYSNRLRMRIQPNSGNFLVDITLFRRKTTTTRRRACSSARARRRSAAWSRSRASSCPRSRWEYCTNNGGS